MAEAQAIRSDIEDQLFRWGKWAYINTDNMLGAKPPGWVFDMKIGYELDGRTEKQYRIDPMADDLAKEFDKKVCMVRVLGDDYLKSVIAYYCFRQSLSRMDRVFKKGTHYHRRLKDEATTFLAGLLYESGY